MSQVSRLFSSRMGRSIAVLALALVAGSAGSVRADDVGGSDVTVPEHAPPAEEPELPKLDTHAHTVGQPPHRSAKEFLKDVWTRDKLSGDWGGLRTDLAEHGVYPEVTFTQIGQGVATGGANILREETRHATSVTARPGRPRA